MFLKNLQNEFDIVFFQFWEQTIDITIVKECSLILFENNNKKAKSQNLLKFKFKFNLIKIITLKKIK